MRNHALLTMLVSVMVASGILPGCKTAPKVYEQWPFSAAEAKQRQQETAAALGVRVQKTIDLGEGVKLELVLIPAGEFTMGSRDPAKEVAAKTAPHYRTDAVRIVMNEHPRHRVRITKPFYMGRHEVTQAQWERLRGHNWSVCRGPDKPGENVSWYEAQECLAELNARVAVKGTFTLPTEAEWEYACRAGTSTPFNVGETLSLDQTHYDWDDADKYCGGKREKHHASILELLPVGTFAPNAFGLYDLHGNATEWCSDWFDKDYYRKSANDDPRGPKAGKMRVLRGGTSSTPAVFCRSASRARNRPSAFDLSYGFRVVLRIRD